MCPMEETLRRYNQNDVQLFEQPLDVSKVGDDDSDQDSYIKLLQGSMIKQYQRSAADHTLAIPHLVRTPL
jgi:hypothetical protein